MNPLPEIPPLCTVLLPTSSSIYHGFFFNKLPLVLFKEIWKHFKVVDQVVAKIQLFLCLILFAYSSVSPSKSSRCISFSPDFLSIQLNNHHNSENPLWCLPVCFSAIIFKNGIVTIFSLSNSTGLNLLKPTLQQKIPSTFYSLNFVLPFPFFLEI